MYCAHCGKEIDPQSLYCPHCGAATGAAPLTKRTNGLAVAGFVLSFFVPIVGIILSIIGRKQCLERNEEGGGLALAGIIISCVTIALALIALIGSFIFWAYLHAYYTTLY